jgi:hypothetical protein
MQNSTANTYVENTAYVLTAIYNFESSSKSYNSRSCELSMLESVKNMLTKSKLYDILQLSKL